MRIQITITGATQAEVDAQYKAFAQQMQAQGMHQFQYNALVPKTIHLTYLSEDLWKIEQERIHASCRNSAGGMFDKSP